MHVLKNSIRVVQCWSRRSARNFRISPHSTFVSVSGVTLTTHPAAHGSKLSTAESWSACHAKDLLNQSKFFFSGNDSIPPVGATSMDHKSNKIRVFGLYPPAVGAETDCSFVNRRQTPFMYVASK